MNEPQDDKPLFRESYDAHGIARITLDRPEVHNAFNDRLIADLAATLHGIDGDETVRAVVLAAEGRSFSAGGDLKWMRATADYTAEENLRDAEALAELMRALNDLGKPTMALVQGPAYGGGVGLLACCDVVVAVETASFALSEVRLGLIPAAISPYVVAAIGARAARRYFLTGERFSAEEAHRIGLVHKVVAPDRLEDAAHRLLDELLAGGSQAQCEAKRMIFDVANAPADAALRRETAERIARIRASDEGREGLNAFLEKRKPTWTR